MLTYVVVLSLGGRTQLNKLKEDGMNVSLWLSSLASFCGHLAKSYSGIQVSWGGRRAQAASRDEDILKSWDKPEAPINF